jgi:glutathione S-transferase
MIEKKLEYELIVDNVWSEDTQVPQYNPLGKVPCLVMDDGGSLFDSRVIVEYLDTLSPVSRLLPQGSRDRTATKCWEAIGDGLCDAAVAIRIENHIREPQYRSPKWLARQHGKIVNALTFMNDSLGQQPFCMGVNFSLADIAVGCALGYLDFRYASELDWRAQFSNLARLYEKLQERPSFASTAHPAS